LVQLSLNTGKTKVRNDHAGNSSCNDANLFINKRNQKSDMKLYIKTVLTFRPGRFTYFSLLMDQNRAGTNGWRR